MVVTCPASSNKEKGSHQNSNGIFEYCLQFAEKLLLESFDNTCIVVVSLCQTLEKFYLLGVSKPTEC